MAVCCADSDLFPENCFLLPLYREIIPSVGVLLRVYVDIFVCVFGHTLNLTDTSATTCHSGKHRKNSFKKENPKK